MTELALQAPRHVQASRRPIALLRAARRHAELLAMVAIVGAASAARLVNLTVRPGWDGDQGQDAIAVWTAVTSGRLPTFGPLSSVRTFHHGALYYDLLLPAGWLGNGDPTAMAFELALFGILIVPIVWWVARSIGGPAAGVIAALLAAVSTALIRDTFGVWNPNPVAPGAALALLGTWQAWRTGRGAWWLVAALGADIAAQSQLAAAVGVIPVAIAYALHVATRRGGQRLRLLGWGAASAALVVVTLLPLIAFELGHDFAESRAIAGFLVNGASAAWPPDANTGIDRPIWFRLIFGLLRILGWPLTGWPLVSPTGAFLPALAAALVLAAGLASRVLAVRRVAPSAERTGILLVTGTALALAVLLSLALREVSQIQELPTEQYHSVADPVVIVATGLVLAAVARSRTRLRGIRLGPGAASLAVAALVAWNVAWWPPLEAYDGGWPAAAAAAHRVEETAAGGTIGLVSLPAAKAPDAYRYPLMLDHARLVDAAAADYVVVLCDSFWVRDCRGPAEEAWRAANGGDALKLAASFDAAPDRTLTVYRRVR